MLRQREAIRHPGDVVADGASFALLAKTRHHVCRKLARILPVGPEELGQGSLSLLARLHHSRVRVEIELEEILEIILILLNFL